MSKTSRTETLILRVTAEDRERWQRAVILERELTLSSWVRRELHAAADKALALADRQAAEAAERVRAPLAAAEETDRRSFAQPAERKTPRLTTPPPPCAVEPLPLRSPPPPTPPTPPRSVDSGTHAARVAGNAAFIEATKRQKEAEARQADERRKLQAAEDARRTEEHRRMNEAMIDQFATPNERAARRATKQADALLAAAPAAEPSKKSKRKTLAPEIVDSMLADAEALERRPETVAETHGLPESLNPPPARARCKSCGGAGCEHCDGGWIEWDPAKEPKKVKRQGPEQKQRRYQDAFKDVRAKGEEVLRLMDRPTALQMPFDRIRNLVEDAVETLEHARREADDDKP